MAECMLDALDVLSQCIEEMIDEKKFNTFEKKSKEAERLFKQIMTRMEEEELTINKGQISFIYTKIKGGAMTIKVRQKTNIK